MVYYKVCLSHLQMLRTISFTTAHTGFFYETPLNTFKC